MEWGRDVFGVHNLDEIESRMLYHNGGPVQIKYTARSTGISMRRHPGVKMSAGTIVGQVAIMSSVRVCKIGVVLDGSKVTRVKVKWVDGEKGDNDEREIDGKFLVEIPKSLIKSKRVKSALSGVLGSPGVP